MNKKKRKLNTSWQDILNYFIVVKKSENTSDLTIRDYENKITRFFNWMELNHRNLTVQKISVSHIREYINYLLHEHIQNENHPYKYNKNHKNVGLSPVTVNIHISYLKGFFNFLSREGIIPNSPLNGIHKIKTDMDKVNSLEVDEVKNLLFQIDKSTYAGLRDYCVLILILDTGIRIGELLKLQLNDFNMQQCSITIGSEVSKVRKMRVLPISPIVAKTIFRYVEQRDSEWNCDYLFTTYEGNPLGISSFRKRLHNYADKAGLNKRIYPYLMRHTFSLLYLTINEGDPFSLQRMLGHSSMNMTRKYVNLKDKNLKDKHLLYSPVQALLNNTNNKRIRSLTKRIP